MTLFLLLICILSLFPDNASPLASLLASVGNLSICQQHLIVIPCLFPSNLWTTMVLMLWVAKWDRWLGTGLKIAMQVSGCSLHSYLMGYPLDTYYIHIQVTLHSYPSLEGIPSLKYLLHHKFKYTVSVIFWICQDPAYS